jgi:hypothetical protein
MTIVRVKGIKHYQSKGRWYAYHRKTGTRFKAEFGTGEFFAELATLERKVKVAKAMPGTLGMLFPTRTALRKNIRSVSGVKVRKGTGTLHTIIEASAGSAPSRMRNRWVQALLYADKNRSLVESEGLAEFLKANSGIAGCAAKMAKVRTSNKQKRPSKLKRPLESAAHMHGE